MTIPPFSAEIRMLGERPALFLNGEPRLPLLYALTDSPGGRWAWEEISARNIAHFAAQGFRMFNVSVWFEDVWQENGAVDISRAVRQIRGILEVAPDAAVMIRLHVNAPRWWEAAHPEEGTEYADGPSEPDIDWWGLRRHIEGDLDRRRLHSLASRRWRTETASVLAEFCRQLAGTPEGGHLIALHLCSGVSHEWHYWGFLHHEPDTGAAMTGAFRTWLRGRYGTVEALRAAWRDSAVGFETASVPGLEARRKTDDGLFRDPQTERPLIDYCRCQHEETADSLLGFARTVKEAWPRPLLVGAFYGYFYFMFSRQAAGGHLDIDRVLRSPYLDYFSAPQSYFGAAKEMGGPGCSRGLIAAARLHGKLWIDEMDEPPASCAQWNSLTRDMGYHSNQMWGEIGKEGEAFQALLRDDIAKIRRNGCYPVTCGAGVWFFDFGPARQSGWWDRPELLADIGRLAALLNATASRPMEAVADVLVVWDSNVYAQFSGRFWNPFTNWALDEMGACLYHAGAMFDEIFLADLPEIDLTRYKAVVFGNTWRMTPEQRRFVREQVCADGRHVVFNYLTGYSDGDRNALAHVEDVTGFSLVPISSGEKPSLHFRDGEFEAAVFEEAISPFAAITPGEGVHPLGTLGDSDHIIAASRKDTRGTRTLFLLPWHDAALMRSMLRASGAHLYTDSGDIVHDGLGLLCLHTLGGGRREILLRNGRRVTLDLPERSTTILDSATGEVLLGE